MPQFTCPSNPICYTTSGTQADFERAVRNAEKTGQNWKTFSHVPDIDIDTRAVVLSWESARDSILALLQAKQAAPLERFDLDHHALVNVEAYNTYRQVIVDINKKLLATNEAIHSVKKQAEATRTEEIHAELAMLHATKARFSDEIRPLCENYIKEKEAKIRTESERNEARKALNEYRTKVFPGLQNDVNKYLKRFNTSFHIDRLVHANVGGGSGSTCTYNLVINRMPVAVKSAKTPPGKPSFRNSLSAGDRRTLALALFLSSLDQCADLTNAVVVIDDPISSLDDHRALATVRAIRDLSERVGQVILLSHNKRFLRYIWRRANHKDCRTLEIGQNGVGSTIRSWDVSLDVVTEHDRRHKLLLDYAESQSGDNREVAAAIRPHLEGFLRVACPGKFPLEGHLGGFIRDCRATVGGQDEILNESSIQELDNLRDYGNLFHHDTNPAWEKEEINATQLRGYVRRTLDFTEPLSFYPHHT